MARHTQLKNNKAYIIFNTVLKRIDDEQIRKIRARLGIPLGGFDEDMEAYDAWLTELEKSIDESFDSTPPLDLKKDDRWDLYLKVKNWIKSMDPRLGSFGKVISEYITLGWPTNKAFFETNTTGCEMIIINDKNREHVDAGVYIRIGEYSLPENIKEYISNNTKLLSLAVNGTYGASNLKRRLKTQDFYRNNMIYTVSQFDVVSLKSLILEKTGRENLVGSSEKSILACNLLRHVYGIDINESSYLSQLRKERMDRKKKK